MDSPLPDRYWKFLTELKGHSIYLSEYLHRAELWDSRIKMYLAITSSSSIAAWVIWKDYGFVWAFIIASSQVINAIKSFLPFERQIKPLKALCYAMDELFLDAERQWFQIEEGDLSESELNLLLFELKGRKLSLWKKILDEISLPHNSQLQNSAQIIAEEYFKNNYQSIL